VWIRFRRPHVGELSLAAPALLLQSEPLRVELFRPPSHLALVSRRPTGGESAERGCLGGGELMPFLSDQNIVFRFADVADTG
jgi:hypothetical protein